MRSCLVTGATGFIGQALLARLAVSEKRRVLAAVRRRTEKLPSSVTQRVVGDIGPATDWADALAGIDVVIHLAARAHIMADLSDDPLLEFRRINVEGSVCLAKAAVAAGVKRFIFISSIGVNGNRSNRPFTCCDEPSPVEPYAISKLEAEIALRELISSTGMELVIVRPPLVYGPGAPGNFGRLIRAARRSMPLPLGAINNRRSLVSIYNLVDLIDVCVEHPRAAGETFLVSDGEDLSTPELIRRMAGVFGTRVPLVPVPLWLLLCVSSVLGKKSAIHRLTSSLQVDIAYTRERLKWTPPVKIDEALAKMASCYREQSE